MSQPDPDPDRYKSRGRKERTPAQLAVLAQAREKADSHRRKSETKCVTKNGPLS